MTKTVK